MDIPIIQFQGEYRFLSNFWPCKVSFGVFDFPSVENAYQALKCKSQSEMYQFTGITAGQAKRLGRKVEIIECWDTIKVDVMHFLLEKKFFNNAELAKKLKATGNRELVEGNTWGDCFWGVDLLEGSGENNLGKLLMKVRENV